MYNAYNNFQLSKENDRVKISCDSLLVLESKEDDEMISIKFPKCLHNLFESKFPTDKYDIYNVYTLKVANPNKITDYKKIWELGGFDTDGLYDNLYDVDGGRIYFDITKNIHSLIVVFGWEIFQYYYLNIILPFEDIFNLFVRNKYDISFKKEMHDYFLSSLQKLIKESVIIDKISATRSSLNIYGDNVGQKYDVSELPKVDIIER
jgi:hypothetical protein